jgi:hypothetical protein
MEIIFEPKQKYVFVKVIGEMDLQKAKELFVRLLGVCAEHKLFKIIVDYREMVGFISVMDRLSYLEGVDALHKSYIGLNMPKLKIAYVAPRKLNITEAVVLDKREALTFDNMTTHDIESAEKWVME